MYCEYFGFSEMPFSITSDPNFLYLSPDHEEVLTSLIYGIQSRVGIIEVVGDVGAGKTTILKTANSWLSEKTEVAYICNFDLTFKELLKMVLVEFKISKSGNRLSKVDALGSLNEFALNRFYQGGNVVIFLDEAQNLNKNALENVRLLSNMETPKSKLIQIVLCGQPELDVRLNQPEFSQIKQRITVRCYIKPLNQKETYEYINHRVDVANYDGKDLFDTEAKDLIWKYTAGVPRKINVLCDNAFLIAFKIEASTIDGPIIEKAIRNLGWQVATETIVIQEAGSGIFRN